VNPSKAYPVYTVSILANGSLYDLSDALVSLSLSEHMEELAARCTIRVLNLLVRGQWLASLLHVRDRVTVTADDGTRQKEVFRGVVWSHDYQSALARRELTLLCYDALIYLQESEDAAYFSDGRNTRSILSALCGNWNIPLQYQYETIIHSKLALKGSLADIVLNDLLDSVQDRTETKYVVLCQNDALCVKHVGTNSTIWSFQAEENAISTQSAVTMDGLITKIFILGNADDNGYQPVEAVEAGDTGQYGTLQKIMEREENTALTDAQQEARNILSRAGTPKTSYVVQAVDLPWARKGDLAYINAGGIYQKTLLITGIDRDISPRGAVMTLTLEEPGE